MAKKFWLHIKWVETKEKNHSKAGDRGIYDEPVVESGEIKLLGHIKAAVVTKVDDDQITLSMPEKGEYVIKLNETAKIFYSDGYQVAGDWVDESLCYEITLSDVTLSEYNQSLPDFEIENGVLKKSRVGGPLLIIPEEVTEIGHNACHRRFYEEVVLPSTIKKIGSCAFEGCKYLTKVNLPEGLEEIGSLAFAWTAIEELEFPKGLRFIDSYAFSGTPLLDEIKNDKYVIIGGRFLYLYNGYDDVAEIPDGITAICPSAFELRKTDYLWCFTTPKKVVLPGSVKKIGKFAFRYLCDLQEINLREDMEIDENAFEQSSYEQNFREFLAAKGERS